MRAVRVSGRPRTPCPQCRQPLPHASLYFSTCWSRSSAVRGIMNWPLIVRGNQGRIIGKHGEDVKKPLNRNEQKCEPNQTCLQAILRYNRSLAVPKKFLASIHLTSNLYSLTTRIGSRVKIGMTLCSIRDVVANQYFLLFDKSHVTMCK